MQKFCFISTFILLITLFCASAEPMWYSSRTFIYPESEYVSALGSGKTEQDAKNDALCYLAFYFGVSVDIKKSAGFSATEKNGSTSKNKFSNSKTDIEAKNILPAVEFTETFQTGGIFYICAYIRRSSAISELSGRAENALSKASFLVMRAEDEQNKIAAFKSTHEAKELCAEAEKVSGELAVLDFEKSAALFKRMRQIKASSEKISDECKKALVFAVVSKGDDGSAESVVKEILEKEGFLCDYGGKYTLFVELLFQESSNNVGVFVKPSVSVQLYDEAENMISSYTKSLPKFGHRTLDAAYSKARVEVVKDLRANLARELFE